MFQNYLMYKFNQDYNMIFEVLHNVDGEITTFEADDLIPIFPVDQYTGEK